MKVEGISSYYAFMYNRNTGKITSDNEADDGFADFYNSGNKDGIQNLEYNARKARFDSLTSFFGTPGAEENSFNPVQDSGECTIIEEKVSDAETRYYVDGKLMFTSLAGEFTADIKFAPDAVQGAANGESLEFEDVSRILISDIKEDEEEGHVSPKRKTGSSSQVIVSPDGSRWLITTMYLCGKEIKIVKKLPPIDPEDEEEDSLLRQDDNEKDKPGIADADKIGINRSLKDVLMSYLEDGFDKDSLLFADEDNDKK